MSHPKVDTRSTWEEPPKSMYYMGGSVKISTTIAHIISPLSPGQCEWVKIIQEPP